ncbi:MAG: hypothetical protein Q8N13_19905 [Acidovorax sp.]|nr:hypothetical protein [Acidovorax sp.]
MPNVPTLIKRFLPWTITLAFLAGLASCPYSQWQIDKADKLVDQLCEKDAGIYIYERVEAPASYFKVPGEIPLTPYAQIPANSDHAYVLKRVPPRYFKKGNPAVVRIEVILVRQSDQKTLSRQVSYSRYGGEPALLQSFSPIASQYHCSRFVGSGSDFEAASYTNSPPFDSSINKPRIFR